jgi:hypothetical protein
MKPLRIATVGLFPFVRRTAHAASLWLLLVSVVSLLTCSSAYAQVPTTLQVVHNAPDPALASVGVWIEAKNLPTGERSVLVNPLPAAPFRSVSPVIPSFSTIGTLSTAVGLSLTVNITAPNAPATPATFGSFAPYILQSGANIIFTAGVLDTTAFAANPEGRRRSFSLAPVVDTASSIGASNVRLVIHHGSTDAPQVDVIARGVGTLARLSYGQTSFITVPLGNYTIDIRPVGTSTVVASYSAPLQTLGWGGQRVIVAASGFYNTLANRNGPSFGLLAAVQATNPQTQMLPAAQLPPPEVPLVLDTVTSLHIIHNAPDPALASIGLWVGLPAIQPGGPLNYLQAASSFPFRTATPALTGLGVAVPSLAAAVGVPLTANITAAGATVANPALVAIGPLVLRKCANIVIATGLLNPMNFAANPTGAGTGFTLVNIFDTLAVPADRARLVVYHGSPDAPRVEMVIRSVGTVTTSYNQVTSFDVPIGDYVLDVRPVGSTVNIGSYSLPLRSLSSVNATGKRVIICASGFVNPAANQNGQSFGLLASVGVSGTTPSFLMLPQVTTSVRTAADPTALRIESATPNPASDRVTVRYEVKQAGGVELAVINVLGEQVLTLPAEQRATGIHEAFVDVSSLPAGAYRVLVVQQQSRATVPIVVAR